MEKVYSPREVEARWSEFWRKSGTFHCEASAKGDPYVIVIPPPNVTGALHIGHALNDVLQDVLIRYRRLTGRPTCWVPGTDHGGIATQSVMERQLKAEGLTRHQMGRGKFIERMHQWTRDCKSTILGQLARLGCALDWPREAFTMDEVRGKAVYKAFEALWKKGLIKRGERMVNWCVRCGTALSDIEVEHEERKGHLWHMRYPATDGGGEIVVATTRPETMLGDTAVAVNPRDARYTKLVGKTVKLPLMDRPIPIVADDSVDFAFGTGAVKVTPAHDPNDFEIGQRHKLPSIKVIGPDGRMTQAAGAYAGLSREAARDKILADLVNFLVKTEPHPHSVGACYRCGHIIEPLLSWQWFVRMQPLAAHALEALHSGRFRLYPESWAKPYREWLEGIKDWCISRQIWWGHRIPVWYCLNCNRDLIAGIPSSKEGHEGELSIHQIAGAEGVVSATKPSKCAKCSSTDFIQDPDVLDTWFSSALWPMSVFGWPEQTPELKAFYPTEVLVTGYEILYLWVARMQVMGLELLGEVPFPHALIHGIVRDKTGKKMSKSLGNVIDPLVMMDKYGTDAFRFSLLVQAHPGRDIPFAEASITGSRNFANKIWNSTRFVLMNLPELPPSKSYSLDQLSPARLEIADRWILAEYQRVLDLVRDRLEHYEIAAAADTLYGFLWDAFCDWYVELTKIRFAGPAPNTASGQSFPKVVSEGDGDEKETARTILICVLTGTLKMLHPFMPYITEELYQTLRAFCGETADFITSSGVPNLGRDWTDAGAMEKMRALKEITTAIRTLRSELNVPPGMKLKTLYQAEDAARIKLLQDGAGYVAYLARLESFVRSDTNGRPPRCATVVASGITFYVPLEGVIDFDKERQRLEKTLSEVSGELKDLDGRLANEDFLRRAPKEKVEEIRSRRQDVLAKHSRIRETLDSLN